MNINIIIYIYIIYSFFPHHTLYIYIYNVFPHHTYTIYSVYIYIYIMYTLNSVSVCHQWTVDINHLPMTLPLDDPRHVSHTEGARSSSLPRCSGGFCPTPCWSATNSGATRCWKKSSFPLTMVIFPWKMVSLPSGYVKIAIENGHRNSGFTH